MAEQTSAERLRQIKERRALDKTSSFGDTWVTNEQIDWLISEVTALRQRIAELESALLEIRDSSFYSYSNRLRRLARVALKQG